MSIISQKNGATGFGAKLLSELRDESYRNKMIAANDPNPAPKSTSFSDHLLNGIKQVDGMQKVSDKMATEMAVSDKQNLHETMIAASQAELGFNLMVQVRNKVLEAYQEVMRMQV